MKGVANGVVSVLVLAQALFCVTGCGAAQPEEGASGDASENVDMVPLALSETTADHPAVAAIQRNVSGGPNELWVFACDGNFRLMRNIRDGYGMWLGWKRIASKNFCIGTPAVAQFENFEQTSDVVVFWREFSGDLMQEQFSGIDAHTTLTNLSSTLGIGRISTEPVVANLGNDTGAMNAVSIAIEKLDAKNELWTVDFKAGAWATYPVLRADGTTAYGYGRPFTAFGPPSGVYDRTFITAQAGNNQHVIYARTSWARSYKEYARTNTAQVLGQLSIAHKDLFDGDPTCAPRGCAMYRDKTTNYLMYAPLSSGGDLTAKFLKWDDHHPEAKAEPSHMPRMGSSLSVSPDHGYYIYGMARSEDGWPMLFTFSTGSSLRCTLNNHQTIAAPVMVINSPLSIFYREAFYVDTNYQLQYMRFNGSCQSSRTDMGLQPLFR